MRENWVQVTLGDLVTQRKEKVSPTPASAMKFLGMDCIESSSTTPKLYHDFSTFKSDGNQFFKGDILYGRLRPYLNKVTVASIDGVASGEFIVLQPNSSLDSKYAMLAIHSQDFVDFAMSHVSGDRPRIKFNQISSYPFKLPPVAEQRAIVAKLEVLFSELDKGVQELKNAQEKLKVYRQTVLKKAFEGELTKDWRAKQTDLPTGEELLDQIRDRRAKYHTQQLDDWTASVNAWQAMGEPGKKPRKPSKSPPVKELREDFLETLGPLPNSWIWVTNDELMFYVTSGSRDWKRYYSEDCGAYFVRTQDIKTNSLDIRKCAFVDLPEDVEGKRSLIETGDLLMTITGANVGKIAHIQSDIPESYVSQSVALMKYVEKRMGNYLHYYFQSSSHGAKHIGAMVYGVGRPVLSLEDMREAPVALCTLNEQIEIVRILDSLLSTCDKLDSDIQKGIDRKGSLRQSLLMKAFRGELLSENELMNIQKAEGCNHNQVGQFEDTTRNCKQ